MEKEKLGSYQLMITSKYFDDITDFKNKWVARRSDGQSPHQPKQTEIQFIFLHFIPLTEPSLTKQHKMKPVWMKSFSNSTNLQFQFNLIANKRHSSTTLSSSMKSFIISSPLAMIFTHSKSSNNSQRVSINHNLYKLSHPSSLPNSMTDPKWRIIQNTSFLLDVH